MQKKTQVIWIGSRQQLAKFDIKEFQLLIVCLHYIFHHSVQSRCSSRQSAHYAGSCGGNVPLVLLPAEATADYQKIIDNRCRQDVGKGVFRRSAWLLQQSTVRCQRGTPATSAKCPERGGTVYHWYSEIRSHSASVAQPPVWQRITFKIATLMYRCLNRLAPSYLAADCIVTSAIYTWPETVAICHIRAAV